MTLQQAKDYINYCLKEGVWDPDMFYDLDGKPVMSEDKFIKFADEAMARADAQADEIGKNGEPY
jgi:hypothetical protein